MKKLSPYLPQLGLVLLLVAELLYLTISFDTQSLDSVPSAWAQFLGFAPQYLRLAITVTIVTLLVGGKPFLARVLDLHSRTVSPTRLSFLIVHGCALVVFTVVTSTLLKGQFSLLSHPGSWTLAWLLAGSVTLVAWSLALFPPAVWRAVATHERLSLGCGLLVGGGVWATGFLTEQFWQPLARYTFNVVAWMLALIYPRIVNDPARLVIGTPTFKVMITPQCSGYEGVGLILAFLGIYLWLFRKDLRFPGALVLLPLGAATIWVVNSVRIVALVVIGTSGWPAIAAGGFHSQAGWIAFNAVALGFVALTMRGRYFMSSAPVQAPDSKEADPTTAYLMPFLAITATAMLTSALSAGFEWLYPIRVVAAGVALWAFRRTYANLNWTLSWSAIAIGFVTFVVWLVLMPATANGKDGWPAALQSVPLHWAAAWLVFRLVGYVVTVPLAEELAFRGFLTRRLARPDFQNLPPGFFSWGSFLISSALFGALHGGLWLAGTIAGMSFALALYRRGAFGDAVQAHATTNGLIALYAFTTGHWSVWS